MATDPAESRLVLWDIDHTLIETRGFGAELSRAAFEAVTGQPLRHQVSATGKTETTIAAETLRLHGIRDDAGLVEEYCRELLKQYTEHQVELRARGRVLPGVLDCLAALAGLPSVIQTVLTGNLQGVAAAKLAAFDLTSYIDTSVGAFAEDNPIRSRLVPIATSRASIKYGINLTCVNTVIIGDTVADVAAALDGGAGIVAVASGTTSAAELRQAGAQAVLPDLVDTKRVLAAVLHSVHA